MRPTLFTDLGAMRGQECDRVRALAVELSKTGAMVVEGRDWLAVFPSSAQTIDVSSWIKKHDALKEMILHVDGTALKVKP